ncbi:diguanylate cyclase [Labrenzia sp. PHM005]|uniref:sensor domain-containing diguanylate cyclase n=1 Tax=Labrenzia sp. PHM005 TaxID=2590016 RepID=UPI0011403A5C|nr:diguanylate cyclase [Labrenzia sp. PHM005]QDG76392.1 diguanylate cyclase [Labrenzia sp. PHM005]
MSLLHKSSRRTIGIVVGSVTAMLFCITLFSAVIDRSIVRYMQHHEETDALQKARATARLVLHLPDPIQIPSVQESVGHERFDELQVSVSDLSRDIEARVSIIAENGVVLADSDMSRYELLHADNHAERPELVLARADGQGVSQRYSTTLQTNFLYAAYQFPFNNNILFSRVAVPLRTFQSQITDLRRLLIMGMLAGLFVIGTITTFLARALTMSIRLRHERLEGQVAARTGTLRCLHELGSMLAISTNMKEAGTILEIHLPKVLPGTNGALLLFNNSRNLMIVEKEWGGVWKKGSYYSPDSCWSLRKNAIHHSCKGGLNCQHLESSQTDEVVCIPLMALGETLGIIQLTKESGGLFSEQELEIAQSVGKETAIAISNLNLRATLEQQALHDPLTGLNNRRYIEEKFDTITFNSHKGDSGFWILIIDVDHFKKFNDTYGHDAGDFILVQLGKLFKSKIAANHVACRLGGEEFAVLMPDQTFQGAYETGENLRKSVEQLKLKFEGTALGGLTISSGLASYPRDGNKLTEILKTADELLYCAKRNGRNQVRYDPQFGTPLTRPSETSAS